MAKEEPQEPDLGEYTDYLILSSSEVTQGWRHNIMRLAPASSSDTTDVRHWTEAKLNRRDMQRVRREEYEIARKAADHARAEEEAAAARERGEAVNGAEVELKPGMPGYMAAQAKKEEEQRDDSKVAPAVGTAAGAKRPKRGFGAPKKTRRIFVTEGSSKERRLRFEERHPWVLETEDDKKPPNETRWVGKMDSSTSAAVGEGSSYICLVLDPHSAGSEAAFKVVPANRWYKFASRPKYHMLTADEAEAEFEKMQKASDLDMWFSSRRTNTGAVGGSSSSNSRNIPGTSANNASSSSQQSSSYRERLARARGEEDTKSAPSRLRTVYGSRRADDDLFGDEEAAGPSGKRAGKAAVRPRRRDDDEREDFEFEEDFQDDEEGIGQVGDDALDAEENRQLEERIKREMRDINAFGPAEEVDEIDEDEIEKQLTKTGRRMKKLLKKRGRRGRPEEDEDDLDDDDDDDDDDDEDEDLKNPYASEEEEESDSDDDERKRKEQRQAVNNKFTATQPPAMSRNGSLTSSGPKYPGASTASSTGPSRSASVGPPGSRAASPGASPPSMMKRAVSPTDSRPGSRAASPTPPPSATKRKAEEGNAPTDTEGGAGTAGPTKRRNPGSPSPAPPTTRVAPGDDSALIARAEIIAFIRDHTPTTKELLKHFKTSMARDPRNREVILQVTKEVAAIVDGKLGLKPGVVA